ncbi:MAG: phytanoyl-CoA dioxygenase family protein [Caldilineaceae bacterium]|nr:phytanoyl-CoA dioxygenase family protein [Caldilineaceae bacterium]
MNQISPTQWTQYEEQGYLHLGRVLDDQELHALQQRIDEIMLGTAPLDYDRMLMQLDSTTGDYKDMPPQTNGHKGATLNYRKIQDLELDPLFFAYMQKPLMQEICAHVYGDQTPVASFRAMFMNKPAGFGTLLPWHQDRWSHLDRDPLITVWTALDPATIANGCVKVIPGSHRNGLLNPDHPSGFVTAEQSAHFLRHAAPLDLELDAGEAVLLHNWLLHSSDTNRTTIARRAFSVCYMDANTVCRNGQPYPVIFGAGAL